MHHGPYPVVQDDEIDLFELAKSLWQQKRMILGITAVVTIVATAIAFMIPPIYKSEAIISRSSVAALAPTNRFSISQVVSSYNRMSGTQQEGADHNSSSSLSSDTYMAYLNSFELAPEDVFMRFYEVLSSADTIEAAFRNSLLIQARPEFDTMNEEDIARFYEKWRDNITIKLTKSDVTRIHVTLEEHDPALAAAIINDYLIPLATQKIIDDERLSVTKDLDMRKASLLNNIQIIKLRYIGTNLERQDQLKAAIAVAEAGGITKLQSYNTAYADGTQHLFLLGSDILRAELTQAQALLNQYRSITIAELMSSDLNALLIPGIAKELYDLRQISRIEPDFSRFAPVHIEQAANVPFEPEKPNKKLIIAIGLTLGLMLSVFIALIRAANQNRKIHSQSSALSAVPPSAS